MLQEKVRADLMSAMKAAKTNEKLVLSFLLSKIKNRAIEIKAQDVGISDIEVITIIQKLIKELEEEINMYKGAGRTITAELKADQILILNTYLPKMLSDVEIKAEINKLDDKTIPSIMKYFKLNFAGRVDMSLVSKIVKDMK